MKTVTEPPTRDRIVEAASKLFYAEGIGRVSVDAVAEKAGVTKRTLYYHFESKDDLIAAYLEARDQPALNQLAEYYLAGGTEPEGRIRSLFEKLAQAARHPKWRGCGFLRTAAELAAMPGHPAVKAGARHKRNFEDWLTGEFFAAGLRDPADLAREILILIDGAFAIVLVHRDANYFDVAGRAAERLVAAART